MNDYKYSQQILSDKIFDFIYKVSMRDAVLRGAYEGNRKDIDDITEPKTVLRNYINELLNNGFSSQEDHDNYFLKTAKEICLGINNSDKSTGEFHFGNAQKLINIAVKHIYAFCYHDKALRENFRFCHCPMDSIMLGKVLEEYESHFSIKKRKEELNTKKFFLASWGKEDWQDDPLRNRYMKFQQAIKDLIGEEDLFPIEFDYLVWNEYDANSGAGEE